MKILLLSFDSIICILSDFIYNKLDRKLNRIPDLGHMNIQKGYAILSILFEYVE